MTTFTKKDPQPDADIIIPSTTPHRKKLKWHTPNYQIRNAGVTYGRVKTTSTNESYRTGTSYGPS